MFSPSNRHPPVPPLTISTADDVFRGIPASPKPRFTTTSHHAFGGSPTSPSATPTTTTTTTAMMMSPGGSSSLRQLSERARHDPCAWEQLTRKARRKSFARRPSESDEDEDDDSSSSSSSSDNGSSFGGAFRPVRQQSSMGPGHGSSIARTAVSRSPTKTTSLSPTVRLADAGDLVERLHRAACTRETARADEAQEKLAQISEELLRARGRQTAQHSRALCSMARVTRRVAKQSTPAATLTLRRLGDVGILQRFAEAVNDRVLSVEEPGGEDALAVLAAAAERSSPTVATLFKDQPQLMCNVSRWVMQNSLLAPQLRLDAANLVLQACKDSAALNSVANQDPTLLSPTATTTAAEARKQLMLAAHVRKKQPRRHSPPKAPAETVHQAAEPAPAISCPEFVVPVESLVSPRGSGFDSAAYDVMSPRLLVLPAPSLVSADRNEQDRCAKELEKFSRERPRFDGMRTTDQLESGVEQTTNLLAACCRTGKVRKFVEADGHEVLLMLMRKCHESPTLLGMCLDAFGKAADVDPFMRDFGLQSVFPAVEPTSAAADKRAAESYVSLFADCIVRKKRKESTDLSPGEMVEMKKNLDVFLSAWETMRHRDAIEVKENLHFLRQVVADDTTQITLEIIHRKLVHHKNSGGTLNLQEERSTRILFEYVCELMTVYGKTDCPDALSFVGKEIMHGCLSFQVLLLAAPENETLLLNAGVPRILLNGMSYHSNQHVVQHYVLTAVILGNKCPAITTRMAAESRGPVIVAEIVKRGIAAVENCTAVEVEELLKARLELVRLMATTRRVFAETQIMTHLITLWDNTDLYYFDTVRFKSLEEVQKLYRKEWRGAALDKIRAASRTRGRTSTVNGTTAAASPLKRRASIRKKSSPAAGKTAPAGKAAAPAALQRRASAVANKQQRAPSVGSMASNLSSEGASDTDWEPEVVEDEIAMMAPILRTMRAVVCGAFIEPIEENLIPLRLVGMVVDQSTDPAVQPHVLFLIGALASVPQLKDLFGTLQAVERILDLMKRAYKHDVMYVSEIVCNAALALASLVVVHPVNVGHFQKHGGTELTVKVLRKRGEFNDTRGVNGTSALICNLCYKNEELKRDLGVKGACEALVQVMRDYRAGKVGSSDGPRCVSSSFKAIGNLALNPRNMLHFMSAGIPAAYADFLQKLDGSLDESTSVACFRTLANLVIEKDNMAEFVSSLGPTLSVLRKITSSGSADLFRWILETIGNLCRHPESAALFTASAGIETILALLPHLPEEASLHSSAIFVLGIQTSEAANVPVLVNSGVLDFTQKILSNFSDQLTAFESAGGNLTTMENLKKPDGYVIPAPSAQLAIAALRCTRRVLTERCFCEQFVDMGGLTTVLAVLQRAYSRSMLCYEALRIFFLAVAFYSGEVEELPRHTAQVPSGGRRLEKRVTMAKAGQVAAMTRKASVFPADQLSRANNTSERPSLLSRLSMRRPAASATDASNVVLDSDGKPLRMSAALAARAYQGYSENDEPRTRVPLGQRPHEKLGLTEEDAEKLIRTIRLTLAEDKVARNLRLYRLGFGLLCYFACEKIGFHALYETLRTGGGAAAGGSIPAWDRTRRKSLTAVATEETESEAADSKQPRRGPGLLRLFKRKSRQDKRPGAESSDGDDFGRNREKDDTAVLDLIFHVFTAFRADPLLLESAVLLLYHLVLCATTPEELHVVADWNFFNEAKQHFFHDDDALDFVKEALKLYRIMLEHGSEPEPEDHLTAFYHLVDFEFPLELSGWSDDPYPDGPQSLPAEVKLFLRDGGKLEALLLSEKAGGRVEAEKRIFVWKSSHDMLQLQWRMEDPKQTGGAGPECLFPCGVPISLTSGILPGAATGLFHRYAKQANISEGTCLALTGQRTADMPEGLSLCLRAKSQKERDSLISVLCVWRDSAAYGFR